MPRKALEYSFTIPSYESKPNAGQSGSEIKTFYVESGDVILTGLYPQKDIVVARLFKSGDQDPVSTLQFEKKGAEIIETNLDGKYIRNVKGKMNFIPWEIKTFQIRNY